MNKKISVFLGFFYFLASILTADSLVLDPGVSVSSASIIYHGSQSEFETPQPKFIRSRSQTGEVVWVGSAVFASSDFRIALFYTHNKQTHFLTGIDLEKEVSYDEPVTYILKGGTSVDEALSVLYGESRDESSGFIYVLDANDFHWEKGLGVMEKISYGPKCIVHKHAVNRRKVVDDLVAKGLIRLHWIPGSQ